MSILAVSAAAKAGKDVTSLLIKQAFTEVLTPESIEMLLEDPERLVGAFDSPAVVRKFFNNQNFQDAFFKQTADYRNRAMGTLIGETTSGPYDTMADIGGDYRVVCALCRIDPTPFVSWTDVINDPVALEGITDVSHRLLQFSNTAMDLIAGSTQAINQIGATQAGRTFLLTTSRVITGIRGNATSREALNQLVLGAHNQTNWNQLVRDDALFDSLYQDPARFREVLEIPEAVNAIIEWPRARVYLTYDPQYIDSAELLETAMLRRENYDSLLKSDTALCKMMLWEHRPVDVAFDTQAEADQHFFNNPSLQVDGVVVYLRGQGRIVWNASSSIWEDAAAPEAPYVDYPDFTALIDEPRPTIETPTLWENLLSDGGARVDYYRVHYEKYVYDRLVEIMGITDTATYTNLTDLLAFTPDANKLDPGHADYDPAYSPVTWDHAGTTRVIDNADALAVINESVVALVQWELRDAGVADWQGYKGWFDVGAYYGAFPLTRLTDVLAMREALETQDVAVGKVLLMVSDTAPNDYTGLAEVVASTTAMNAITANTDSRVLLVDRLAILSVAADSATAMGVVASHSATMRLISDSAGAMGVMVASTTAMDAIVASSTAMVSVGYNSATGRAAIGFSGMAFDKVAASDMAVGKLMFGYAGVPNYLSFSAIVGVGIRMSQIAANDYAMRVMVASQTAMDIAVANSTAMTSLMADTTSLDKQRRSQLAMDTIVASTIAMNALVASPTALSLMRSTSVLAPATIAASTTAMTIVAASQLALEYFIDRTTYHFPFTESTTAMNALVANTEAMEYLTGRTNFIDAVNANATALNIVQSNAPIISPQNMTDYNAPSPYVVEASSEKNLGAYLAWEAFNSTRDYWLSEITAGNWISLDFGVGNTHSVCRFYMWSNSSNYVPDQIAVEYSHDGTTWLISHELYTSNDRTLTAVFDLPDEKARYWRIRSLDTAAKDTYEFASKSLIFHGY